MNVLSLGGRSMGMESVWDCARSFLGARFSGRIDTAVDWERSSTSSASRWPE